MFLFKTVCIIGCKGWKPFLPLPLTFQKSEETHSNPRSAAILHLLPPSPRLHCFRPTNCTNAVLDDRHPPPACGCTVQERSRVARNPDTASRIPTVGLFLRTDDYLHPSLVISSSLRDQTIGAAPLLRSVTAEERESRRKSSISPGTASKSPETGVAVLCRRRSSSL